MILVDLWKQDPVAWSETMITLKQGAVILLLPIINELNAQQLVSAGDIIGKVGTEETISHLEEAMAKSVSEGAKKSMQAAIDEIKNRP